MHSGLPQGTLPLCLKVKLKCLCSAHRETSWPCPPVNGRGKEEMNTSPHPLTEAGQTRYFARLTAILLYFLPSSPSLICKRNGHPDPTRWHCRTLVPHLAFRIKPLFLASTPRLPIIGMVSTASLDSVTEGSRAGLQPVLSCREAQWDCRRSDTGSRAACRRVLGFAVGGVIPRGHRLPPETGQSSCWSLHCGREGSVEAACRGGPPRAQRGWRRENCGSGETW